MFSGSVRLAITALIAGGMIACASSDPAPTGGARATRSPNLISQQEIEGTTASNAYELVNRLRPQWLRASGVGSISGGVSTMQYTLVYLDNVKLGTVDNLRSVSAAGITSIRFLTAERAASTLPDVGRDPINGAIVISTK